MENMLSFLGPGVIVENGAISTTEDFAISGKVCTKVISTANVVIGSSAVFEGMIIAHNLEIKGSFSGSAYVKENLIIRAGSKVSGKVQASVLNIESGASFVGKSETISTDVFNKNATSNKVYSRISTKQITGRYSSSSKAE